MPQKSIEEFTREVMELHAKLHQDNRYQLRDGKWDKDEVLRMLAVRKALIEKAIEAVEMGLNRGTVAESLLNYIGIEADLPMFF
jgi:hypothetical protein